VSHSHCPAGYDLIIVIIILLNRIVNVDVYVRECVTETTLKLLKVLRTVNVSPMLRLAIAARVLGARCIEDFLTALVPDLLEPLPDQNCP
jgi:hypothetical protein